MSRRNEEGQVFVLAALCLTVLIGVAAFCVNASFMFYQHQRMQAQVDEQTRYSAGSGCVSTWPTGASFNGGTLVISPTTFFAQDGSYCDGVFTKQASGLFGNILRFPNKISVHAVAEHGGTTEPYFSMLGLSPSGDSHGCSIYFQDASMVATIDGNAYSDSSSLYGSCGGNRNITFTSPYTYTSPSSLYDPFQYSFPTVGNTTLRHCQGSGSGKKYVKASISSALCLAALDTSCFSALSIPANADDYYQANTATAELNSLGSTGSTNDEVYLPYCSGSSVLPTVYLVDGASGNAGITDNSTGNTTVVSSTIVLQSGVKVDSSGAFTVTSPATGPFAGYAFYQTHSTPCGSYVNAQFTGTPFNITGLFDMACANVTFSGSGSYSFQGSVIGYTITFAGASSGTAVFVPPPVFPPRGSFLVQ